MLSGIPFYMGRNTSQKSAILKSLHDVQKIAFEFPAIECAKVHLSTDQRGVGEKPRDHKIKTSRAGLKIVSRVENISNTK